MNPRLVVCMTVSALVGLSIATLAILSGWGALAAFGLYSLSGSVSLVVTATVAALAPDRGVRLAQGPAGENALA